MTTHFRKHARLPGFDYRANHAYFVTVLTANRACVFGSICNDVLRPTQCGLLVEHAWHDLRNHHPFVELDAFVVMPNHIHGIICITGDDMPLASPTGRLTARSVGAVVGSFKSAVTRSINRLRPGSAVRLWQTSFFDHVIRPGSSLDRVRDYIVTNPSRWSDHSENDAGTGKDDVEAFTRSLRAKEPTGPARGDAGVAAT